MRLLSAYTRRERVMVLLWAVFVMGLTCLPYLYALRITEGREFGGFLWGVDEGNVYAAWMRQAAEGEVFLRNQYAPVPENPRFFNLYLHIGGRLSALTGLSPVVSFHVLRLLGGIFLLLSFAALVAELSSARLVRWAALGCAALGSGLGWLVVLFGEGTPLAALHPVDMGTNWQVQPEAVTFPSLLLNGLFTTSMALMCLAFLYALRALRNSSLTGAVAAGFCVLILGNIHTYNVFPVHLALLLWMAYGVWTKNLNLSMALRYWMVIFVIGLPSLAWAVYAALSDPAFMAKGLTPTPAGRFMDYAAGYGLIGLLAVVGAVDALRRRGMALLPVAWVLAHWLVLLVPVSFQRKMVEGLHLPLCFLAALGIAGIARRMNERTARQGRVKTARERMVLAVIAAVVFTLPSNALFTADCLARARNNNAELLAVLQPPIYIEAGDAFAMNWLGTYATAEDVVVSSSLMGSYIPTRCRARVFVGHWAETLALNQAGRFVAPGEDISIWQGRHDPVRNPAGTVRLRGFRDNLAVAHGILSASEPQQLVQLLHQHHITLVYYGPWERGITAALGSGDEQQMVADWLAGAASVLDVVYNQNGVVIMRTPSATQP